MWNQNNGNGQGNGYPQQQYQGQPQNYGGSGMGAYVGGEDTYDRLNQARDVGDARFPFIEDGQHRFAVVSVEEQPTKDGPRARAILKVITSTNPKHQPGSFATKMWYLTKPAKFQNGITDGEEFVDFVRKLKGAPAGTPMGADMRLIMKERPRDQITRGTVVDCNGVMNRKGNYVKVYWNTVQQTPEAIASMRQQIEAAGLPTGPQQVQQPMQHPAMSQQGTGGPYPAPGMQGFPSSAPNGQWAQPPQPQQPMQQTQGYAQPPAPQQGYVQQPATQGPPPSGFLGSVPTNGGWQR